MTVSVTVMHCFVQKYGEVSFIWAMTPVIGLRKYEITGQKESEGTIFEQFFMR